MSNQAPISEMPEGIVEFIADIFERRGAESYLGEPVTVSEHMLQSAWLAEQENAEDELVAAALLHDIGSPANSGHIRRTMSRTNITMRQEAMFWPRIFRRSSSLACGCMLRPSAIFARPIRRIFQYSRRHPFIRFPCKGGR